MWEIKNPIVQKTTLDFTSSGQGFCEVSQLISDGIVIINALKFLDFDDDLIQLIICDHCGTVGCQSGNWIRFRRFGDFVLMIPDFEDSSDDWSKNEYSPPRYFSEKGIPYFTAETYKKLQKLNFPPIEKIKNLEMREAVRLMQFSSPAKIFGENSQIKIDFDKAKNIVAASEGEPIDWLSKIEEILRQNCENKSLANLRLLTSNDEIIYLFIDDFEFRDWRVLVRENNDYHLILDENFAVRENNQ